MSTETASATPAPSPKPRAYRVKAYAMASAKTSFAETTIPRREPTDLDVQIEILFCGVCHSDIHFARGEWSVMPPAYPAVPGHEVVGRVKIVGANVTKFKIGDLAGADCLGADLNCPMCQRGLE